MREFSSPNSKETGPQTAVGIGELIVTRNPRDIIVIPNLGSCLAVVVFDKVARVGGAVHCLLPLATPDADKKTPGLYVDTGVPLLLNEIFKAGASKKDLVIVAVGCASINDANSVFEIGKKNHTVFKRLMWKNSLLITAEEIGGTVPRTVHLKLGPGTITVSSLGKTKQISI
jgi:chemotaxis protein CheD